MDCASGISADLQGVVMKALRFLVVVLIFIAGVGATPLVHAQQPPPGCGNPQKPGTECTQQEAYADCAAFGAYTLSRRSEAVEWRCIIIEGSSGASYGRYVCRWGIAPGQYNYVCDGQYSFSWQKSCPSNKPWNEATKTCGSPCSSDDPQIWSGGVSDSLPLYTRCLVNQSGNSCEYLFSRDPAGSGHIGTPIGASCKPDDYVCPEGWEFGEGLTASFASQICIPRYDCPEGQTLVRGVCRSKPDECPAGKVLDAEGRCVPERNTCPAGQVKGPDGSCVDNSQCPDGKVRGADGTCKDDDDGDGNEDGDDPNDRSFSGGDDCNTPPACSGDPIACGQARILWRIDCNTRRNVNISGGSCDAVPVCAGEKCDALEYAQLLQTWKIACSVEKLKSGSVSGPAGDANRNGVPDVMEQGVDEGPNESVQVREDDGSGLLSMIDQAGFAAGGGCPGLPPLEVAGMSLDLGSIVCEHGAAVRAILLTYAIYVAATIIGARSAGG